MTDREEDSHKFFMKCIILKFMIWITTWQRIYIFIFCIGHGGGWSGHHVIPSSAASLLEGASGGKPCSSLSVLAGSSDGSHGIASEGGFGGGGGGCLGGGGGGGYIGEIRVEYRKTRQLATDPDGWNVDS